LFGELLPNLASTIPVLYALNLGNVLLAESGLSYLGVGVHPPSSSWGSLIAEGQERILTAPWLALFPGLAIFMTTMSLNVLAEELRGALDLRSRREMRQ
jgi:peptide/nickel transport system permease protein